MSEQKVRALQRQKPLSWWKKWTNLMTILVVILLAIATIFTIALLTKNPTLSSASLEIINEQNRNIIRVPAGGDLQAAINKARGGDIIELQAGATYYGEIKLSAKAITDYITIQTSAVKQLPESLQVSPAKANLMAKIISRGKGTAAVVAENGAHHYRFVGIEFAPANADLIYNLVYFGGDYEKVSDVPHHLEIDRCYFHPFNNGVTKRGLALNSADTVVKNSYFEGFAFQGEETQGICGWTGSKNIKIINNYVEGGAENIMFGGADPKSAEFIPTDIEIRNNLLAKPLEWKGTRTIKTFFELKNAKRVQFTGNFLENGIKGAAITVTVRNQDGSAPFSTIEDVTIRDNIIKGAGEGINILGKDDTYPSQTMKRLKIVNNLWLDIDNSRWEGRAYFILISSGEDVEISHNTVFQTGNIITSHGAATQNFVFHDNILSYGEYGLHSEGFLPDMNALKKYFTQILKNNVIVNTKSVPDNELFIPAGNFKLNNLRQVGFTDLAGKNFGLSAASPYKGKGDAKSDIGANFESIKTNMPPDLFARLFR